MKYIFLFINFILLLSLSLSARIKINGELYMNYAYSSSEGYLKELGNDKFEVDYAAINIEGDILKNINGRVKYMFTSNEIEMAYLSFTELKNSNLSLQFGKQYNIFGLKNTEATDMLITSTIEQVSENKLSGDNPLSIVMDYTLQNIGKFAVSFQDDDTGAKLFKGYTLKLSADKILNNINLSFSYQNRYNSDSSIYEPQYSIGIDINLGEFGISCEHINIDKDLVNNTKDCKILSIESFFGMTKSTKFIFDYLKVDDNNFSNAVLGNDYSISLDNINYQIRCGFESKFNDNFSVLGEWGKDKGDRKIDWYKIQFRASI